MNDKKRNLYSGFVKTLSFLKLIIPHAYVLLELLEGEDDTEKVLVPVRNSPGGIHCLRNVGL